MTDNMKVMWSYRTLPYIKPATYQHKTSAFIDKDFQIRYTLLILGSATVGMILVALPIYYFVSQNYAIFVDLAYGTSPGIIKYLEHEQAWLNSVLFGVGCGIFIFVSIIGFKMTSRIVGPIMVLKNHLKQVSRGHWYLPPPQVRRTDEFHEFIETYNYFYKSFQTNLRKDLQRLKKIQVDPRNRDAYLAWKSLVEERCAQLDVPFEKFSQPSESDAPDGAAPDLHRAS